MSSAHPTARGGDTPRRLTVTHRTELASLRTCHGPTRWLPQPREVELRHPDPRNHAVRVVVAWRWPGMPDRGCSGNLEFGVGGRGIRHPALSPTYRGCWSAPSSAASWGGARSLGLTGVNPVLPTSDRSARAPCLPERRPRDHPSDTDAARVVSRETPGNRPQSRGRLDARTDRLDWTVPRFDVAQPVGYRSGDPFGPIPPTAAPGDHPRPLPC